MDCKDLQILNYTATMQNSHAHFSFYRSSHPACSFNKYNSGAIKMVKICFSSINDIFLFFFLFFLFFNVGKYPDFSSRN